jgi:DNA-binding NarL/FixJ family response regulator
MLPEQTIRWLVEQNRDFAEIVRTAHGITIGGLTLRETDVLRLLADGKSTPEIARQLTGDQWVKQRCAWGRGCRPWHR